MTKPTLDDIKRSIGHDGDCGVRMRDTGAFLPDSYCNCTRRDKVALLERLQEPTEGMIAATKPLLTACVNLKGGSKPPAITYERALEIFERMLAAAEEAQ